MLFRCEADGLGSESGTDASSLGFVPAPTATPPQPQPPPRDPTPPPPTPSASAWLPAARQRVAAWGHRACSRVCPGSRGRVFTTVRR